jgi:S1-C subfamily serine protease
VADEFERDVKVVRFNDPDGSEVVQRTQTVTALALELQRANSEIGDGNPRRFGAFIQENGGDGVMIQSITAGSPASRIFIKELDVHGYMIPGDVILEANGRPIRSVEDFLTAVRASGDTLEGRVRDPRDGRISTFVADLSQGQ